MITFNLSSVALLSAAAHAASESKLEVKTRPTSVLVQRGYAPNSHQSGSGHKPPKYWRKRNVPKDKRKLKPLQSVLNARMSPAGPHEGGE